VGERVGLQGSSAPSPPLQEPERVEFRARFGAETSPREVQHMIENAITVPLATCRTSRSRSSIATRSSFES
jgi:hypothetical protein